MPRLTFTRDRDALLTQIVKMYGTRNWTDIAAELNRQISSSSDSLHGFTGYTARQCRERWQHYLSDKPYVYCSEWTPEEEQLLVTKYYELGSHWGKLAMFFPSRTMLQLKIIGVLMLPVCSKPIPQMITIPILLRPSEKHSVKCTAPVPFGYPPNKQCTLSIVLRKYRPAPPSFVMQ